MPKKFCFLFLIVVSQFYYGSQPSTQTTDTLEFHVIPLLQMSLRKSWAKKFQDHLWNDAGIKTEYKTAGSFEELAKNSTNSKPKLVLANSEITKFLIDHHQFKAISQHVYKINWVLISTQKQLTTLLKNKPCISVPNDMDTVAYDAIDQLGNTNFNFVDKKTQDKVIISVIKNECPMGIVSNRLFERYHAIKNTPLYVIDQGEQQKKSLILSLSSEVDENTLKTIKQSLQKIGYDEYKYFFNENTSTPPAQPVNEIKINQKFYHELLHRLNIDRPAN